MTIPSELIDFTHIANVTCTACVQQVKPGTHLAPAEEACTIVAGPDTTTLRAELPDQAALWGLVERIMGLGLQVVHLHLVAPESR
jgi:hypothetical protein